MPYYKLMRYTLKELKSEINSILDAFHWSADANGNSTSLTFYNLNSIRNTISLLEHLKLFERTTDALHQSFIYTTSSDNASVNMQEGLVVKTTLTNLLVAIESLSQALEVTVPPEDSKSINVKLPHVEDFEDLSNVSKDLHIALTQVLYIDEIGGKVKIEGVENVSIWINILVGGTEAVSLVAGLAWSAAVIYKKVLEGKAVAQYVRSLTIKNESLDDILNAQKASTALLIQAEAEHIQSDHFHDNLPENVERIKNSIKLLSDLIEKGAVIQPALMAPEEVKNLFPDLNNVTNLESKIKRLNS